MNVDLPAHAGHHDWGWQHRRAPDLAALVDDDQPFFDQDARPGLQARDRRAVGVHLTRAEALSIGHRSADRALDVVDLPELALAVVVANHDADDRFERSTRTRRPRALNLNPVSTPKRRVVAAVTTSFLLTMFVVRTEPSGAGQSPRPTEPRLLPHSFVSCAASSAVAHPWNGMRKFIPTVVVPIQNPLITLRPCHTDQTRSIAEHPDMLATAASRSVSRLWTVQAMPASEEGQCTNDIHRISAPPHEAPRPANLRIWRASVRDARSRVNHRHSGRGSRDGTRTSISQQFGQDGVAGAPGRSRSVRGLPCAIRGWCGWWIGGVRRARRNR